ncbi:uncharacterized protein TNCV_1475331 [Trichonephila clavipes]|nr:uncharacterized protein TNCV_1475331 [Trichonephila clavipes]
MPNSLSQMIQDMLDWRQIWGSGRARKDSNSAETVLWHPCRVRLSIVLFKNGSWEPWQPCGCRMSWTYRWAVTVLRINTRVQFSRVRHHSKRRRRWVGVKGSTRNGRRDPKCPSARHLRMVQEATGALNDGATCAWMATDEAVGCTRVFLTM